ncbi:MAG: hypothetical protein WKF71_11690 [Pyrinomonadaceae bacterium]
MDEIEAAKTNHRNRKTALRAKLRRFVGRQYQRVVSTKIEFWRRRRMTCKGRMTEDGLAIDGFGRQAAQR